MAEYICCSSVALERPNEYAFTLLHPFPYPLLVTLQAVHRALSLLMLLTCEEGLVLYTAPTGGLARALHAFDVHHSDVGVAQAMTCLCVSLCMMRRCRNAVLASGAVSCGPV
jgi:hypothetical protein